MNSSRRLFIASSAILPAACMGLPYEKGIPVFTPPTIPAIRPPKVGQEWTYTKKNVFNGETVDVITERVASVGSQIVIQRTGRNAEKYDDEIQGPWGTIIQDPHWGNVIRFNPSVPLWPEVLKGNWSKEVITKYIHPAYPDYSFPWQLYMTSVGWEKITVPAGKFVCMRFHNLIEYQDADDTILGEIRHEIIWFSPSIGRWVAREVSGSHLVSDQPFPDDSFQWQLTSYK
jgi:hypothetical protein